MDIEKMISEMTLEEKASLLSGADFWHTKAVERLGIPAVMVSDGPHGLRKQDEAADHLGVNESIKAVCFPAASATAASFDRDITGKIGESLGDACQHEGVSVVLGPAVNIKRSPLCGRNFEYFSEDPFLAGELAAALIKGVQSREVGTSIKHFAGNSQEHRRMSSDSVIDERTLREIYLPAFEKAVKVAKPWTVMCSYNRLNGEYASENRRLLTDILRDEWGFDGFVMSDWGAVSDRVKGVAAGMDLEMPGSDGSNDRRVVEAVRRGDLKEEDVDTCVRRILKIVDRWISNRKPDTAWDLEAQHALAAEMAADCMVLLKNEDDVLPLSKEEKVAVIGLFAEKPRYQGGGSSHINSCKVESLVDALKEYPCVTYARGYGVDSEEIDEELMKEAVLAASKADKAVIVGGLPDSFESEGYDRTHMRMPLCQNKLIDEVSRVNPNTVVVLYNGSPVEMPWIGSVKGVIEAYLGGQAVGAATRDILYGLVSPSGRLPETFPRKLEDNPSFLSYGGEGNTAVYTEGIFVGYRYYGRKKMDVLFPFGYGLSYTDFSYGNLVLSKKSIIDSEELTVSVDVTNRGNCAGKEVVQLYVGAPAGDVFRPVRELKGFEKIFLEPGETKTVSITLDKRAFAYWNVKIHDWFVASGDYSIEIGRNSRDIALCSTVSVTGSVEEPLDPVTPDTIYLDLQKNKKAMQVFAPMLDGIAEAFGGGQDEEQGEAASEAISSDMLEAMQRYMPLRGIASFSGAMSYDELVEVSKRINEEV